MNNEMLSFLKMLSITFVSLIAIILAYCMFTGCTVSVTTLHTQGEASDVIDETQSPNVKVDPNLQIPIPLAK